MFNDQWSDTQCLLYFHPKTVEQNYFSTQRQNKALFSVAHDWYFSNHELVSQWRKWSKVKGTPVAVQCYFDVKLFLDLHSSDMFRSSTVKTCLLLATPCHMKHWAYLTPDNFCSFCMWLWNEQLPFRSLNRHWTVSPIPIKTHPCSSLSSLPTYCFTFSHL